MGRWQEAERPRLSKKPKPVSLASRIATTWKVATATILSLMAVVAVGIVVISIIGSTLPEFAVHRHTAEIDATFQRVRLVAQVYVS